MVGVNRTGVLIREDGFTSVELNCRHSLWFAQAPLKRKGASKKRRTFGPVAFRRYDDVEGRFADLLATRPADAAGTGPLH